MAKKTDGGTAAPRSGRRPSVAIEDATPVSLKDLRKRARQTQEDLAVALSVGQDAISRLEKRSDMLLSTLRQYVESVGGQLALVATFPDQTPVIIDALGESKRKSKKRRRDRASTERGEP